MQGYCTYNSGFETIKKQALSHPNTSKECSAHYNTRFHPYTRTPSAEMTNFSQEGLVCKTMLRAFLMRGILW